MAQDYWRCCMVVLEVAGRASINAQLHTSASAETELLASSSQGTQLLRLPWCSASLLL